MTDDDAVEDNGRSEGGVDPFESVEEAVRDPSADPNVMESSDTGTLPDPLDAPRHDEHPPVRERLRARTGLSRLQWSVLVSVVLFLPYPVFVSLLVGGFVTGLPFLLFTLGYSVLAMYLYIVL